MIRRLSALVLAACVSTAAAADPVADFYQGKNIKIVIGTTVGGSYGVFAQVVARHMGRFIPGQPSLATQTMPGAAGLLSLNYLANAAPRDGSVITVIQVTLVQDALFNTAAKFDPRDFNWIGRMDSLTFVGLASKKSNMKTLDEARHREIVVGAPGLTNVPAQAPLLLNRLAGTKFRLITGYTGVGQVFLALERGEVDLAVASLGGINALLADKLQNGDLVPVFAQAAKRIPAYPDIPAVMEFAKTDTEKAFMKIFSLTADIGRALATTPGVPGDRLAALREAFDKMMADSEFQADARKTGLDLDPLGADELAALVREAMNMPPALRDQVRKFNDEVLEGMK